MQGCVRLGLCRRDRVASGADDDEAHARQLVDRGHLARDLVQLDDRDRNRLAAGAGYEPPDVA